MRGALIAALSLVVVAAPGAQAPVGGTIEGHVALTTRVRGTGLPSTIYQPRAVTSHEAAPIPEIKNVIVSLQHVAFRRRH